MQDQWNQNRNYNNLQEDQQAKVQLNAWGENVNKHIFTLAQQYLIYKYNIGMFLQEQSGKLEAINVLTFMFQ